MRLLSKLLKMLKVLEIDYENKKVKIDLSKLYKNIDIAETLSNLTGKWIKKIKQDEVEFEDGSVVKVLSNYSSSIPGYSPPQTFQDKAKQGRISELDRAFNPARDSFH